MGDGLELGEARALAALWRTNYEIVVDRGERLRKALEFAAAALENFSQAYPESYYAEDARDCLATEVYPALAVSTVTLHLPHQTNEAR